MPVCRILNSLRMAGVGEADQRMAAAPIEMVEQQPAAVPMDAAERPQVGAPMDVAEQQAAATLAAPRDRAAPT